MAATAAWLASAEALLNRGIDASAQAAELARRLQGTALQIDVEGITRVQLSTLGGRLALLAPEAACPADATISGSPAALLHLFKGGAVRPPGRAAAQIRGDAELANRYKDLLVLARPDLEEELSRWIGDFPARRLSQFAQRALHFARHARRTAGDNLAEYLQEESRDLVNKTELDEFLHGVDDLRETADRIDARLGRLEQRLKDSA
jgi:ubiquinone biosynthesis protein UbiJ